MLKFIVPSKWYMFQSSQSNCLYVVQYAVFLKKSKRKKEEESLLQRILPLIFSWLHIMYSTHYTPVKIAIIESTQTDPTQFKLPSINSPFIWIIIRFLFGKSSVYGEHKCSRNTNGIVKRWLKIGEGKNITLTKAIKFLTMKAIKRKKKNIQMMMSNMNNIFF